MRILYHHRTQGRQVEGVHIRGIVGALRALGHEVQVLSFPGADPEHEPVPPPSSAAPPRKRGLAAMAARAPGVLFEFLELAYNLVTWWRVGRRLHAFQPQLVYERYALFLCATVWLCRRRGIPVVLEINDSALVPRVRPLYMKRLARRIEGWCFRNATGLVFISSWFLERAREAYGEIAPAVVSPNAADLDRFNPADHDRAALRAARGISAGVVCGYIGGFVFWHGIAEFVRRIVPRIEAIPGLTLLLVGDGVELPAVREAVEGAGLGERILLPGRVSHADIPSWIACMDYALLADSNEYGSPMKLFELMAMGVGVVAPDYGPIREVVDDGKDGWLFRHKDFDACVLRVLALAANPHELARVGAAARATIVREHQWRNNAEQLLSLMPGS
jgi:glycosyltransferase involved in cell wall biosynthesis